MKTVIHKLPRDHLGGVSDGNVILKRIFVGVPYSGGRCKREIGRKTQLCRKANLHESLGRLKEKSVGSSTERRRILLFYRIPFPERGARQVGERTGGRKKGGRSEGKKAQKR